MSLLGKEGAVQHPARVYTPRAWTSSPAGDTIVPTIFMYLVAFALAATVTLWFAPMALWQGSGQPNTVPSQSPAAAFAPSASGPLQVRHEGPE